MAMEGFTLFFRCVPEDADMDSGADSTTHCIQSEGTHFPNTLSSKSICRSV